MKINLAFFFLLTFTTGREAIYVVDGLLHNEAIRSTMHFTDTHGYTEAVFGLMNLLGFDFAPRIAKLYKQQLYAFEKIETYRFKDLFCFYATKYIQSLDNDKENHAFSNHFNLLQ